MPGLLGAEEDFAERYAQPIERGDDTGAPGSGSAPRSQPFILRRPKTEVATDLPPKTETVAYCELGAGAGARSTARCCEERRRQGPGERSQKVGFKRARVSILAAPDAAPAGLLRSAPAQAAPGTALGYRHSAKLRPLRRADRGPARRGPPRAGVQPVHRDARAPRGSALGERNIAYLSLDGGTRGPDRPACDAFNSDDGPPIFLISLKAGGTGLNLTAADTVIHYDPWWNPAVEDQATDRAHRIGQTQAVISYKLITRGTVEEKILALQQRKRALAQGILGPGGGLSEGLTEQDIEALFTEG